MWANLPYILIVAGCIFILISMGLFANQIKNAKEPKIKVPIFIAIIGIALKILAFISVFFIN